MSKSVNVDFVTRQIEVDTDGKEHFISAAMAAKDAEQSMFSAQNAATHAEVQAESVKKYKALWFDSVAEMKAEPSLTAGAYVNTAGYHTSNDGGGASYLIRTKADADIDDGGSIHQLSNGLVAELIIENGTVNVKQFGAKGDNETDDTINFQKCANYCSVNEIKLLVDGWFILSDTITVYNTDVEFKPNSYLFFSNQTGDGFVFCNCHISNFRAIAINNFTGALFHCDDTMGYRTYPNRTLAENVYLDSNNTDYVGTLFKHTGYGYGNIFRNFKFGRYISADRDYTNNVEKAVSVVVNAGTWLTGCTYSDFAVDVYSKDNCFEAINYTDNFSNFSTCFLENIQIQTRGPKDGFKHKNMFYMKYAQNIHISNCNIWDFTYEKADASVVYNTCNILKIVNSAEFAKFAHNVNPYNIEKPITTIYGDAEKQANSDYFEDAYRGTPVTYAVKYTNDVVGAVPFLIPTRESANNEQLNCIEIFTRLDYGTKNGCDYLYLKAINSVYAKQKMITCRQVDIGSYSFKKIKFYQEGIVIWLKGGTKQHYFMRYRCNDIPKELDGTIELTNFDNTKESPAVEEWNDANILPNCTNAIVENLVIDNTTDLRPDIAKTTYSAPAFIGQIAVYGGTAYVATGLTKDDWKQITN